MKAARVLMSGPLPPAVGGMASVLGALGDSSLSRKVALTLFETGKTTPPGRPLWQGILARLHLIAQWWRELGKSDLAHIHTCSGLTFFLDGMLLVLARLRGVPVVLHVHGARFDDFLDGLPASGQGLARWLARRAQSVVVLSQEWQQRLAGRLPGANLQVVANGVPATPMNRSQTGDQDVLYLFLGNLGTRKGVPVLLEAVSLSTANWRLALAGGEEEPGFTEWTRAEIARRKMGDRVQVLGPVIGAAKLDLLRSASAFVLPSLAEGLPMALLEAMAAQLPVVVTAVGAMPGVIKSGCEGYLVPPGDAPALAAAMDQLAASASDRQRMGLAAAQACDQAYGVERMVDALFAIYSQLVPALRSGAGAGAHRA